MDRSFAASRPAARRQAPSRTGHGRGLAFRSRFGRLSSAPAAAAAAARQALPGVLAMASARRRARIAAICLIVALPLLGGGWLWLRHSSLVAVEHVRISGVHGPQAGAIEAALLEAAKRSSTLDVDSAGLRAAVSRFPAVSAVRATPRFPHSLRIEVTELPAVAALVVGGTRTAVAANGTVLGPGLLGSSLPDVADDVAPGTGSKLSNPLVLQALAVLGAAPGRIGSLASRAWFGARGLTVAMRDGLLVYFGDASRPHAKWLALAAVLADSSSAGASYVDVRLPERPAAGFPPGAGPQHTEEGTAESHQGASESTVSALAAGLTAANPKPAAEPDEATAPGGADKGATSGEAGEASSSEPHGEVTEGAASEPSAAAEPSG